MHTVRPGQDASTAYKHQRFIGLSLSTALPAMNVKVRMVLRSPWFTSRLRGSGGVNGPSRPRPRSPHSVSVNVIRRSTRPPCFPISAMGAYVPYVPLDPLPQRRSLLTALPAYLPEISAPFRRVSRPTAIRALAYRRWILEACNSMPATRTVQPRAHLPPSGVVPTAVFFHHAKYTLSH